ncbi:helix-turn-helix domain-containing protein [Myroides injenensis]|nr:AraC family transcriptional regulator [Myroides injenensis]
MTLKTLGTNEIINTNNYSRTFFDKKNTPIVHEKIIDTIPNIVSSNRSEYYYSDLIISKGDIKLKQDILINFYSEEPIYELHFCLEGQSILTTNTKTKNGIFRFNSGEHNLYHHKELTGIYKSTQSNNATKYLELIFKSTFIDSLIEEYHVLEDILINQNITHSQKIFETNLKINYEINYILMQMMNNNRTPQFQRSYLKNKAQELLLLQLEQYLQLNTIDKILGTEKINQEKIIHVKEIIEKEHKTNHTLSDLSKRVGINEFKLKKEFKKLFNKTVFGYLFEVRMEYAANLLLNTCTPIKEIAQYCGYEYSQHFTTAFKRLYNITPAEYRKKKKFN